MAILRQEKKQSNSNAGAADGDGAQRVSCDGLDDEFTCGAKFWDVAASFADVSPEEDHLEMSLCP